jgi:hypothetical protein
MTMRDTLDAAGKAYSDLYAEFLQVKCRVHELEALLRMWHKEAVDEGKHLDSPGCCATWQALARSTDDAKATP